MRIVLSTTHPSADAMSSAGEALRRGFVVAFPTDTVYALAVDPRRSDAIERLFVSKHREPMKAVALIASDVAQVERFTKMTSMARRLAARFWPGPLTLLLEAPSDLPTPIHGGTGKVGVRVPAHAVAQELARVLEYPVTATSANLSGEPPLTNGIDVERTFGDSVALVLDGGPLEDSPVSTIIDATGESPQLVRAGAVRWAEIEAALGQVGDH